VCWVSRVDGVNHIPDLAERWRAVPCPLEGGLGASARACPGAVI
jgi:hypothetical protein